MKKLLLSLSLVLIISTMSFAQTVFSLRADGVILKSGQPWFPMGFYIDRADVATYTTLVNSLAASGSFNVINLPSGSGDWNAFLNVCSSKGIYVLSQLDYEGDFTAPVYTYKNHAAMYGWSVADDADNGYFTVAQLVDRHNQLKAADPNHVTETSLTGYYLARRQAADTYTAIADAAGYQCYPITPYADYDVTAANALTETYLRTLLYVNSSAKVNRPMIMTNQAFNWNTGSSRFPTVAEERNMLYSGLAAGVKGVVSYVYNNDLINQTSLWNECKALRTDVSTLEGALLNGALTRVNTGDQELVESYWIYNNICYVVVVNTSYSNSKNVSLTLPTDYSGTKTSLFSRMPNTLTLSGTTLSGSIAAQAVQVYSIGKVTPSATYYRIKSHQYNKYMWDNGTQLGFGTNAETDYKTHWILETVDGYTAIKNRSTGHYINIETSQAYAECTAVSTSYWSAQWSLVDVSGYKVIKNRWKNTESLNVGSNLTYVQHTANYPSGYWDGEWQLITTLKSAIVETGDADAVINNIEIYPNPATSNISLSNVPENANISVYTMDGKVIANIKANDIEVGFNVSEWNKGIYLFKVQSNSVVTIKKAIIE